MYSPLFLPFTFQFLIFLFVWPLPLFLNFNFCSAALIFPISLSLFPVLSTCTLFLLSSSLAVPGGGKGACRFCGTVSNTGMLSIGTMCSDPECQERAVTVCDTTLACGHPCSGVKGESECLPCLHGCSPPEAKLRQDADDMCMICYTEGLSCAPCVQVSLLLL